VGSDGGVWLITQGQKLAEWWQRRTVESQKIITTQLTSMVKGLQAVRPPPDCGVSNLMEGSISSQYTQLKRLYGPFDSVEDFHNYLHERLTSKSNTWFTNQRAHSTGWTCLALFINDRHLKTRVDVLEAQKELQAPPEHEYANYVSQVHDNTEGLPVRAAD